MEEMYEELVPPTNPLWTSGSLSLLFLFRISGDLYVADSGPKFIEWVKAFVVNQFDFLCRRQKLILAT